MNGGHDLALIVFGAVLIASGIAGLILHCLLGVGTYRRYRPIESAMPKVEPRLQADIGDWC